MLASSGADQAIRLWGGSGSDWSLILEIDTSEHHSRTMRSLAWNVDGTKLAVASFDATISVWKVVPGSETPGCLSMECATVLSGHENEVKSVAYSPSGQLFASCSRDRSVWVYDAQETDEYECVALLQSHTQDVKAVRWHPQQDVLFSCSYDDTIKVWGPDGDDWCCKETLEGHGSTVWALCFDEKGSHFVSCSDDRNLRLWAPTAALPKDFRPVENEGSPKLQAKGDAKASAATLFSAAMTLPLFRGTLVPTARPVPNGKDVEEKRPNGVTASRSPPADACCGWSCVSVIKDQHPRPVYSVDWSRNDHIASACGDDRIRVFGPEDGSLLHWECLAEAVAHDGDVNCVAWGPSQSGKCLLASAGDDAEVVIWEFSF